MKGSTVKIVAIGALALAGAFVAFKAYAKVKAAGQAVADAPGALVDAAAAAAKDAYTAAQATVSELFSSSKDTVSGAIDSLLGNAPVSSSAFAVELTSGKWDESTKTLIGDFNQAHGRGRLDYSGWRVYSDGTIITPAGEYLQMNYSSSALDTKGGYAANLMWSPTNGTAFDASYPSASALVAELSPPGFSGTESFYP